MRIAIVGLGFMGSTHLKGLQTVTGATLAAVAESDPIKRSGDMSSIQGNLGGPGEKFDFSNVAQYSTAEELFADPNVDAVMIATPVYLHPEHFEAAVKSGKHIYMEKPAGLDVAGCKRVMKAADSADRKINITFGFQQRYGGVYVKAQKFLASGAIGKIREVHGEFLKFALQGNEAALAPPRNEKEKLEQWKLWRSTFGEVIVETYVHNLDAINWFLGSHPLKALGTGGRTVEKRGDLLDHLSVTYDYPDRVQMSFIGSQMTPRFFRSNRERYIGENGFIETAREYWSYNTGSGLVTE